MITLISAEITSGKRVRIFFCCIGSIDPVTIPGFIVHLNLIQKSRSAKRPLARLHGKVPAIGILAFDCSREVK